MAVLSKRAHEGYLLIDHSNSPGVPDDLIAASGLPGMLLGMGATRTQEMPTMTCSHCEQVVILNPSRTRDRGYCSGCDHYICDACTFLREVKRDPCAQMARAVEVIQETALKAQAPSPIWMPPADTLAAPAPAADAVTA